MAKQARKNVGCKMAASRASLRALLILRLFASSSLKFSHIVTSVLTHVRWVRLRDDPSFKSPAKKTKGQTKRHLGFRIRKHDGQLEGSVEDPASCDCTVRHLDVEGTMSYSFPDPDPPLEKIQVELYVLVAAGRTS